MAPYILRQSHTEKLIERSTCWLKQNTDFFLNKPFNSAMRTYVINDNTCFHITYSIMSFITFILLKTIKRSYYEFNRVHNFILRKSSFYYLCKALWKQFCVSAESSKAMFEAAMENACVYTGEKNCLVCQVWFHWGHVGWWIRLEIYYQQLALPEICSRAAGYRPPISTITKSQYKTFCLRAQRLYCNVTLETCKLNNVTSYYT